ncbi:hypothetical protein DERP_012946 [Dermatophagoides pteronyssinus]|uniref:Uncharacterized protein n=1 Tax=Dermatophagoides pteronyssinus TaxID=6956 RepID=A0ABQ8J3S4_DERPT|nr:hypothetical protein DERP_012946 [Dermatophagoides pteronyssinus]
MDLKEYISRKQQQKKQNTDQTNLAGNDSRIPKKTLVFSFLPGIITRRRIIIIITEQKPAEEFLLRKKRKELENLK